MNKNLRICFILFIYGLIASGCYITTFYLYENINNIIKPIPAFMLYLLLLLCGLMFPNKAKWAKIRSFIQSLCFLTFTIGDIVLCWDTMTMSIIGICIFFIGNIIIGLSVLCGYRIKHYTIPLFPMILLFIMVVMSILICICVSIVLHIVYNISIYVIVGCCIYLTSHLLIRIMVILIPSNVWVIVLCCIGSMLYQIGDALIIISVLGNVEFSFNIIYMPLYYIGICLICSALFIANANFIVAPIPNNYRLCSEEIVV